MKLRRGSFVIGALVPGVLVLAQGCGSGTEQPSGADAGVTADAEVTADAGTAPADADTGRQPSADHSSITGEEGVTADGESVAEVTIELRDDDENPVPGVTPEFSASGQGNEYEGCTATDDEGISTCGMTSTEAGDKVLAIIEPVHVWGDAIEFLPPCDESGEPFGGGDGSAEDPHRLCAPEHLAAVGAESGVLGSAFMVRSDLDMAGTSDFPMIGAAGDPFTGRFDGRGFAIENLTIDQPTEDEVGMFRRIEDAEITGVRLDDVTIHGGARVGAIAGTIDGAVEGAQAAGVVTSSGDAAGGLAGRLEGGEITDSHAAVDVDGGQGTTGGLAGEVTGAAIRESSATGTVESLVVAGGLAGEVAGGASIESSSAEGAVIGDAGSGAQMGGLAGSLATESTIADSHAAGDVSGLDQVGGLIGFAGGGTEIEDSYATGHVTGTDSSVGGLVGDNAATITGSHASGDVEGESQQVGGLVGDNGSNGTIEESHATGDVFGEDQEVGGLVGQNAGTVRKSFAAGDASGEAGRIGGLVGRNQNEIEDSYATGDARNVAPDDGFSDIGGLVGINFAATITRSYAAGRPDGGSDLGGLVGRHTVEGTAEDSYWDQESSDIGTGVGQGDESGVTGLDTDDFGLEGSFAESWDFPEVWTIGEAPDDVDRPIQSWQD